MHAPLGGDTGHRPPVKGWCIVERANHTPARHYNSAAYKPRCIVCTIFRGINLRIVRAYVQSRPQTAQPARQDNVTKSKKETKTLLFARLAVNLHLISVFRLGDTGFCPTDSAHGPAPEDVAGRPYRGQTGQSGGRHAPTAEMPAPIAITHPTESSLP